MARMSPGANAALRAKNKPYRHLFGNKPAHGRDSPKALDRPAHANSSHGLRFTALPLECIAASRPDGRAKPALKPFNLSLQPMHANRPTGPLSTYFIVDAPGHLAEVVRSQLSRIGGVESAYIEPPPSVPGKP